MSIFSRYKMADRYTNSEMSSHLRSQIYVWQDCFLNLINQILNKSKRNLDNKNIFGYPTYFFPAKTIWIIHMTKSEKKNLDITFLVVVFDVVVYCSSFSFHHHSIFFCKTRYDLLGFQKEVTQKFANFVCFAFFRDR